MPRAALAILALCGALAGCAGPTGIILAADVVSAAVKAGVDYAEKNKPTPEELWVEARAGRLRSRAEKGDEQASYRLGLHYARAGREDAHHWICRAALDGHPAAQAQMGHWYNEDREREDLWPFIPVRPDNAKAWLWYTTASQSGHAGAGHFRELLAEQAMTPEQVAAAHARLEDWRPGGCGYVATAAPATAR